MAGKYRVIHFQPSPLGTQQNIEIDGFGPVLGVRFKWVLATVDGTNRDNMGMGEGAVSFAGSGFQWACSSFSKDNADPSVATSMGSQVAAIQMSKDDGTGAVLTGTVTSISEGFRITWDVTPTTAWHVEATLYGGDTMQCEAGVATHSGAVDSTLTTTLSDMTIEPEVIHFASVHVNDFELPPDSAAFFAIGVGNDSLEQGGWGYADQNNRTGANRHGLRISSVRVIEHPNWVAAGTPLVSLELTATGVNGTPRGTFQVTKRDTGVEVVFGYFAFSTDGVQASKIQQVFVDANTSGAKSYTGSGFEPMLVSIYHTFMTALGGNNGVDAGGGAGVGSVDNQALEEGSYSAGSQEVDPSNTFSVFGSTLVLQRGNGGVAGWEASLIGFTTTGFDYNIDVTASADRQVIVLTLEVEPWGGIFWENICTEFDHTRTAQEITDAKVWATAWNTSTEGITQEDQRSLELLNPNQQELYDLVHLFNDKVQDEDWLAARVAFFQIRDF